MQILLVAKFCNRLSWGPGWVKGYEVRKLRHPVNQEENLHVAAGFSLRFLIRIGVNLADPHHHTWGQTMVSTYFPPDNAPTVRALRVRTRDRLDHTHRLIHFLYR